jgi:hypothetical protein
VAKMDTNDGKRKENHGFARMTRIVWKPGRGD